MNTSKLKYFFIVFICSIFQISAHIEAKLKFPEYCTYYGYPT